MNQYQRVLCELKDFFEFLPDYFDSQNVIHTWIQLFTFLPDPNTVINKGSTSPTSPASSLPLNLPFTKTTILTTVNTTTPRYSTERQLPPLIPGRFLHVTDDTHLTNEELLEMDRRAVRRESELREAEERSHMDGIIALVRATVETLVVNEELQAKEDLLQCEFNDVFPNDIPHIDCLPNDVYHRFRLKNPNIVISCYQYDCPKKYREVWKQLLEEHIAASRMRPSSSPYASPAFHIPKSDPTAKLRWVNDYRALNNNTISDRHLLPFVNNILSDCATGKIFGKLDMKNSFF